MAITESISVQGKPHNVRLDDEETALLLALNITVNGPVLLYPQLRLCKTNRVVVKDSGKTLRDDSCIIYRTNDSVNVGTLNKVVLYAGNYFIFITNLPTSEEKLCNEHISYLNIDQHIYKICSIRYSTLSHKRTLCLLKVYFVYRHGTLCVVKPENVIDKRLMMDVTNSMNCSFVNIFPNCKPLT